MISSSRRATGSYGGITSTIATSLILSTFFASNVVLAQQQSFVPGCYSQPATLFALEIVSDLNTCISDCTQNGNYDVYALQTADAIVNCACGRSNQLGRLTTVDNCQACLGSSAKCGILSSQSWFIAPLGGVASSASSTIASSSSSALAAVPTDATSSSIVSSASTNDGTSPTSASGTDTPTPTGDGTPQTAGQPDTGNVPGSQTTPNNLQPGTTPTARPPQDGGDPYAKQSLPPLFIGLIVGVVVLVVAGFAGAWGFIVYPRRKREREMLEQKRAGRLDGSVGKSQVSGNITFPEKKISDDVSKGDDGSEWDDIVASSGLETGLAAGGYGYSSTGDSNNVSKKTEQPQQQVNIPSQQSTYPIPTSTSPTQFDTLNLPNSPTSAAAPGLPGPIVPFAPRPSVTRQMSASSDHSQSGDNNDLPSPQLYRPYLGQGPPLAMSPGFQSPSQPVPAASLYYSNQSPKVPVSPVQELPYPNQQMQQQPRSARSIDDSGRPLPEQYQPRPSMDQTRPSMDQQRPVPIQYSRPSMDQQRPIPMAQYQQQSRPSMDQQRARPSFDQQPQYQQQQQPRPKEFQGLQVQI
ncbi:hypothetical protein HDU76_010970 [Blyttiomyces sp. JEL0837]|nr:hypothetical protein HDU76_010970 [Blyttiomyces sp. JEL0837]